MGIKFVENEDGRGIYVEMIVSTGSAAAAGVDVKAGDQLVSVDGALVLGLDFDSALGMITGSADQTVKLTVFRGAQQFLYGPTRPPDDWLRSNNF
jgi:C-terminal processing protease CtpA/Prc